MLKTFRIMTLPRGGSEPGSGQNAGSILIPIMSGGGDADEVIEIVYDELSDSIGDVLQMLKQEKARLSFWVTIALECYKRGFYQAFESLLEASRIDATYDYDKVDDDQVRR